MAIPYRFTPHELKGTTDMFKLGKYMASISNWGFFPQLKFGIYIAVITALITWVGAWHFNAVSDAREAGANEQIAKYNAESLKQITEIENVSDEIKNSVFANSVADNLRLLDGSIVIVPDPTGGSSSVLHSQLDSTNNDSNGSPDSINNEPIVHKLADNPGSNKNRVQQEVYKTYPDTCYEVIFEELYGYVIINHCVKGVRK